MQASTLVRRGLRFYWRTHLGVLAGCAISAAVLAGALFVGDSVRGSLERLALARLGRIHVALDTGPRFFRDDLAARLDLGGSTVLHVRGMAIGDGPDAKRVNRVEVHGVDENFFTFARVPMEFMLSPDRVVINRPLADALGVATGDEISLRMVKPGLLSRDAPLAGRKEKKTKRGLYVVNSIVEESELGRFSLKSDQAAPYNAFIDLANMQEMLKLKNMANLLVVGETPPGAAQAKLDEVWTLGDAGLTVREVKDHGITQLESPRIYLDPAVADAASNLPGRFDAAGALTYLVNSITADDGKSTPYSFMTAVSPTTDRKLGPVPSDMKDDEIIVNRWLADRISVGVGARVRVAYSELTTGEAYVEKVSTFRVRAIVEMDALKMEKDLVPEFPGFTDVDSCKDWDLDLPMDKEKLEDEANEAYWKKFRQTPKAVVTLAVGREMFGNRYGDLMAVRYAAADGVADALRERLDAAAIGLSFRPVRAEALRSVTESMDLGQLFLGMSFFIIIASLLLTAMLFTFTVEQRAREMGVLLAVGHSPGKVRLLFLSEASVVAAAGSLAGIPLGWAFARFLIGGLSGGWSGAVAGASIGFHATAGSAVSAAVAAFAVSLLAVGAAMWRQVRRPVRELVSDDFSLSVERREPGAGRGVARRVVFFLSLAGAVAIVVGTLATGAQNPAPAFFGAGALTLIAGLSLFPTILSRLSARALSVGGLGIRNAARRPTRSVTTAAMLACGCFVVLAVSAMKEDLTLRVGDRASGAGGFELYGETSVAVHEDLNGPKGRDAYRLSDALVMEGVTFTQVRMLDGDDASCLNLNQSLTPPLLGVDSGRFSELGAFGDAGLWKLLDAELPDGVIPAIVGDSATAMWKLKKKVGAEAGDLLEYVDERGRPFKVKLVGAISSRLSVFQGRLLIRSEDFMRLHPSESGHRMLLADVPPGREKKVIEYLTKRMDKVGLDLVESVDRLKAFYEVETTYLTMFLVLGGMGLLLGTSGMGVLVLRNVLERRAELALLGAVGYTKRQAGGVVMAEHRFLLEGGLIVGAAAAALAVAPAVVQPGVHVPFGLLAGFLFGTAALSLLWIWIATRAALRAPLVPALRNE